jgi:hypothetical protein
MGVAVFAGEDLEDDIELDPSGGNMIITRGKTVLGPGFSMMIREDMVGKTEHRICIIEKDGTEPLDWTVEQVRFNTKSLVNKNEFNSIRIDVTDDKYLSFYVNDEKLEKTCALSAANGKPVCVSSGFPLEFFGEIILSGASAVVVVDGSGDKITYFGQYKLVPKSTANKCVK